MVNKETLQFVCVRAAEEEYDTPFDNTLETHALHICMHSHADVHSISSAIRNCIGMRESSALTRFHAFQAEVASLELV